MARARPILKEAKGRENRHREEDDIFKHAEAYLPYRMRQAEHEE
jgi:hypothetical protein